MIEPISISENSRNSFSEMDCKAILKTCEIKASDHFSPPQIAWQMGEVTIGTLGDFSLIIGKAKSRKSFFINIAISTAISEDVILNVFTSKLPPNQKAVLYFDTEQSKYYVQKALKRICKQVNIAEPTNLKVYGLRSLSPQERLAVIDYAINNELNLGFVVIDGIKDLVTSINDEEQATVISSKLLKWTEQRNIHIVTVLHQNKSDTNARGHIGTELINKAETVLSITKAEGDGKISIVEPQQCRNVEPEKFAFEINEDGLPIIAENYELRTETKSNKFDILALEDYKIFQLLISVFSMEKQCSYTTLQTQLQIVYKNQFKKDIGTNSAQKLITHCKNENWILQERNRAPYTLGEFNDVKN